MNNKRNPAEQACAVRLENSARRLLKLLSLNAPLHIIANEVGMIVERAAGLCGKDVLTFPAHALARHERHRLGFCTEDGCGIKLLTGEQKEIGLCQVHLAKWKEENRQLDEEDDDDDDEA